MNLNSNESLIVFNIIILYDKQHQLLNYYKYTLLQIKILYTVEIAYLSFCIKNHVNNNISNNNNDDDNNNNNTNSNNNNNNNNNKDLPKTRKYWVDVQ